MIPQPSPLPPQKTQPVEGSLFSKLWWLWFYSVSTVIQQIVTAVNSLASLLVMTTLGDMIYGLVNGVPARLAGDTTNTRKFLTSLSVASIAQAPTWTVLQSSDLPPVGYASYSAVAQTGAISTTPIQFDGAPLAAALYELSVYASYIGAGAHVVTPTFQWKDLAGITVSQVIAGVSTVGTQANYAQIPIQTDGSTDLTITVTVTGTVTYSIYVVLTRLS